MNQPQVINGRYRLEKLIGQGGIGQVYQAVDLRSDELVAVKALKPQVVETDPKLVERFKREGAALKELNHPNIVKMLAAVEENDQQFLVMEYVRGGSLYDVLKREGKLPIERVLYIALDLSDALIRAHRLKIIHRDIKPANVLLAEDGTPRLTDFGAALIQKLDHITKEGGVVGTVSYLSPEACQGEETDARTDIWAFGIMLFEMLTGRRPFDRRETLATVLAIVREPLPDLVELWPDAPPKLVSLIYRMLEKDPAQRIGSMRQVGAELESIIEHADSGTRQALDLIYRMLEANTDRPINARRLVASSFVADEYATPVAPPPQRQSPAQAKRPLTVNDFERSQSAPQSAPQAAAPAQAQGTANIPVVVLVLGGLLIVALLVIIVLLVM